MDPQNIISYPLLKRTAKMPPEGLLKYDKDQFLDFAAYLELY